MTISQTHNSEPVQHLDGRDALDYLLREERRHRHGGFRSSRHQERMKPIGFRRKEVTGRGLDNTSCRVRAALSPVKPAAIHPPPVATVSSAPASRTVSRTAAFSYQASPSHHSARSSIRPAK